MLRQLNGYIASALRANQDLLPRNPGLSTQLQAKISMLQIPTLASDIISGKLYFAGSTTSMNGRTIPVVAVFPLESMRIEATEAVHSIETALPVLEDFLSTPFPAGAVSIWYGFVMGNSGGGGAINTEDRGSYESRYQPGMGLYEAILYHELSHSYIGNESLTQFLELYLYNMVRGKPADVESWTLGRNYVALGDSNEGYAALLDIYQVIGRDAMARAYRTISSLRPPYGQPLGSESKKAFVDEAPEALKDQVAAKAANIKY